MQEAITVIFGFGVLTVATVALLNVACLRLHDVQKKDQTAADGSQGDGVLYVYVYDSVSAFEERDKLHNLPSFLAWTGVGAIVLVQMLYGIAHLGIWASATEGTAPPHTNEQESIIVIAVITWISIVSYVLALLCVSAVVSNKVYRVMDKVNHD